MASSASQVQMVLEVEDTKRDLNQTKPPKGGWNAAIFIIFVEVAERFAYYGMSSNLIMYLTNELGEATPSAAKNVNTWAAVTSLLPLLGAFLADSFLGRFNTILLASIIYCAGTALLSMSVSIIPRHSRKVWFFVSLYIVAIGEGGHKPCVLTFAADQFREDTAEQKNTKSSFYNWWSAGIAAGITFSVFGVTCLQDKLGWGTGFGVVTGAMAMALAMFLLGINRYRRESPTGSPFTSVAQVFVAAARKRNIDEKRDGCGIYYGNERVFTGHVKDRDLTRTKQFRFLDKAMIMDDLDSSAKVPKDPWRLCSQNQVEEVKLLLRLIPIWLCCLMFPVANSFLYTYFTKQASTMVRTLGSSSFEIPPASLQSIIGVTALITIPIYDRIFIPIARKLTGHPSGITVLQRIGLGQLVSVLSMVASALAEAKRVGVARQLELLDNPKAKIPIRVWWLLPQYVLGGLSDVFTYVGLQELFYEQMPPPMRSLGSAASLSITGIGNFISNGIISLVRGISSKHGGSYKWLDDNINRAHLDYFYWMMAVLSSLSLCAYAWVANGFVYKKVRLVEEEEEEEEERRRSKRTKISSDI